MAVTTLYVRDVRRATPRTRMLRLDLGASGFRFSAGQAVMAGLHASPLKKPYSIASAPIEAQRLGYLELLVQVDDSGGPDPHLELATHGTPLDIEGPFGSFTLPELDRDSHVVLVGGGTGIAPLRSMLVQALEMSEAPVVHVVYSARTADELAYRDELEQLDRQGRIRLTLTVTRDPGAWSGRRGRIDRDLLRSTLSAPEPWCMVCGPPALVSDVRARLAELHLPAARIRYERWE